MNRKPSFVLIATLFWLIPFFHVGWQGGSWGVFPKWRSASSGAAAVGRGSNVGMAKGMVDWCGAADPGGALSQTHPTNPIRGQRIRNLTCSQEPETAISWASIMIVIVRIFRN